jgi:hypothetical protein
MVVLEQNVYFFLKKIQRIENFNVNYDIEKRGPKEN